jgi:hypothetical protein
MNRVKRMVGTLLICLLALSVSVQAQEKRKDEKATHQHQQQQQDVYTCEMHPEVKSNTPGECPKCGMTLALMGESDQIKTSQEKPSGKLTPAEKIKEAKRLLSEATGQLTREGKYNCCIEVPCNQCAMDHQSCPCYEDLKAGKPVCPECYGGWQRGEGKDKKINPKDVKTTFSTHKH